MIIPTESPEKSKSDIAHSTAKGLISIIPFAGGPLVEAFSALVGAPVEKRRDEWIELIATELNNLSGKVADFSMESLKDNPIFITTILQASQIAIKNHQAEKLEALRNIVVGTAINPNLDTDIVLTFVGLIDKLTVGHLQVLKFLNDPSRFMQEKGIASRTFNSISEAMRSALPEFHTQNPFLQKILTDLDSENLTKSVSSSYNTMMTSQGVTSPRTSDIGKQFLEYIKNQ